MAYGDDLEEIFSHYCEKQGKTDSMNFGHAVSDILLDQSGRWFADCGEYSTEIFFCPFCGVELDTISTSGSLTPKDKTSTEEIK